MRSFIVATAWLVGASLSGCGSAEDIAPSLTITPSNAGAAQVTGPTVFTATAVNIHEEVSWTVTGGTVSPDKGLHVTFSPPPGTSTAMLTATAGALTATVAISASPTQLTKKTIPSLTAPVTVQYDAQDVPHIQCAAAVDCLAVQGYVQARDRLFPMDFLRHVAKGKVSELIGIDGLSQDIQFRTLFTARNGKRINEELIKAVDPQTKALLDAFVAGINAYLAELRAANGALPGEYAQLPFPLVAADIDPWTGEDTLAIARLNQFQLSESLNAESANGRFLLKYGPAGIGSSPDAGKMDAWIRSASPATERGHTLSSGPAALAGPSHASVDRGRPGQRASRAQPAISQWRGALEQLAASTALLSDRLKPADGSIGSNNWVVSADKSAAHQAMVANDPHLSLQYPPLFHLSTMTSSNQADGLNLTGGSFPGIPGALVGRGAHVSWGVTVVGYDVTDVYMETIKPCATGLCSDFTPDPVTVLVVPQTYLVRVGPGKSVVDAKTLVPADKVPPVLVVPHHGPVVSPPDKDGNAFSFRWTGHELNTQDLKAFYGLNVAATVDDAITALKNYAVGAQNFVVADEQGHIAYDPHALVPVRKWAVQGSPLKPWFPVPGTGVAEWGDDPAACAAATGVPATCWIADDKLPFGKDPAKGYFFTANADPLGVSDDNDPLPGAGEPPYLSWDWSDSSGFRATRIEQLLDKQIKATGSVSLADMERIQADHVSRPGMAFAPILAAIPDAAGGADFAAAKAILAKWATNGWDCPTGLAGTDPRNSAAVTDATTLDNSAGCYLFHVFIRTLATNVFADDLAAAGQGVNALAALKAMLYMLSPAGAASTSFCNNLAANGTVTPKTCPEQVVIALVTAYRTLGGLVSSDPKGWLWGRAHTMQPVSLLALVTNNYAPGPFARPGGAFTVDVGNPSLSAAGLNFGFTSSGNVRHISVMDGAKPKIRMQLPGPVRDGPTFLPGPDLLGQWVKNTYFDYASGDQINAVATATQSFNNTP